MKRRVFIIVLALLVALMMMPSVSFAASKIVPTKETQFEKRDGEWKKMNVNTYEYNKKGYESKNVYTWYERFDDGSYNKYTTTTKRSYDTKGRISKILTTDEDGTYKDVYTYNTKGKIKKITYSFKKKGGTKYKSRGYTTYSYTIEKETMKTYDQDGKVTMKEITTLNSKGNPKTVKSYWYGELDFTQTYTYKSGKLSKLVTDWGDTKYVEYYNDKGRITKEVATGDVEYTKTYSYDTYGRIKKTVEKGWMESDDGDGDYKMTYEYKYSGYYKKHKYPKTVFVYFNGGKKAIEKTETSYKTVG